MRTFMLRLAFLAGWLFVLAISIALSLGTIWLGALIVKHVWEG
jgi:hypothetical protein